MQAATPIRVGIMGANPDRGWGSGVHRPVLQHLPDYRLVAVGTRHRQTAAESARRFGGDLAFTSAAEMAAHPDIDLVAICVLAPYHHDIAIDLIRAGKHVYCEWPLALSTDQGHAMQRLAAERRVHHAIGLQLRGSPVVCHARDLIADGYVGTIRSATLSCALPGLRDSVAEEGLPMADDSLGTTTLSIHGGHALDALRHLIGEFASLSAEVITQYRAVTVIETGAVVPKTSPDQILVHGVTEEGAAFAAHISSVAANGFGFEIRIHGTEGFLSVSSASPLYPPMAPLRLKGARAGAEPTDIAIPHRYDCAALPPDMTAEPYPGVPAPRMTLASIANLYIRLAHAIRGGGAMTPDFTIALQMHRILDAIVESARSGRRVAVDRRDR